MRSNATRTPLEGPTLEASYVSRLGSAYVTPLTSPRDKSPGDDMCSEDVYLDPGATP